MKDRLQHVLYTLDDLERASSHQSPLHATDARAKTVVTLLFLAVMLSVPLTQLSELLLYALFPIAASAMGGMNYATLLRRSLIVLPFVAFIGIFNPFYDRTVVIRIGAANITEGWITFLSILLRGMLSVQMLLILIRSTGYHRFCRSLQRLGTPTILTTQLLFVFRYMHVLLEEALNMRRARDARSFGRRSYPLGLWAEIIGQLLIRTLDRAELIHRAMLARGFAGRIPATDSHNRERWRRSDTLFTFLWCAALLAMRILHPAERIIASLTQFTP